MTVYRRLPSFRGDSKLSTWIYGIVRHVAAKHRRTSARKDRAEPLEHEPRSLAPSPLERAQDEQARDFVLEFLERLDAGKREVFVLGVLEELSMPEVAEMVGIPLNTAYSRLRRARAEFQAALDTREAS